MLTELKPELMRLKPYEKIMIENRINGTSLIELTNQELKTLSDVCIFKIAAISGFSLSTDSTFADVLRDEFSIFLIEYGYSNLTFDEIVAAFRLNARGETRYESGDYALQIKPYSSFFNLNYAGEVLKIYLKLRTSFDYKAFQWLEGNKTQSIDRITKTL
jgi:hypothetical protein